MKSFQTAHQIVDAFAAALNAKDADALGELFSDDAEFVNILGMRMHGREGIVAEHACAVAGPLQGRVIDFDAVDELQVTDSVSVLHGHCIRRDQRHRGSSTRLTTHPRVPSTHRGERWARFTNPQDE